jgi:hypothetical protein
LSGHIVDLAGYATVRGRPGGSRCIRLNTLSRCGSQKMV